MKSKPKITEEAQSLDRLLGDKLSGIKITPELLESLTDDEYALVVEQVGKLRKLQATQRYADYVEYVHRGMWKPCRHLVYVCQQLDEFLAADTGKPYDILILNLPPQTGKSFSVTETLPSFYLGKHPTHRVLITGYAEEFARRFGRRNLEKIREYGQELFGTRLAKSPCTDETFELDNKFGQCLSRGIMGQITGSPANLVIIDDPIKNASESDSETYRERVWEAWNSSIKTRIHPGSKVIVMMTRWHEDDLAGRMFRMESEFIWKHINLPQEAEDNDLLGRAPGEPLAPELGKDAEWLKATKKGYEQTGMRTWFALHQGRPRILQGNLIKEGWFGYWFPRDVQKPAPVRVLMEDGHRGDKDAVPLPLEFDELVQSWDCTFKDAKSSDYVVGTVWGRYGIDYYLLDMSRAKRDITDTMDAMRLITDKWPQAKIKLIEDKANGPAVISLLRSEVPGIVAINPKGSKDSRVNSVLGYFESGHIYIPHPAVHRWANDVVDEFTSFPNGMHDDIVDSCTQALRRLSSTASVSVRETLRTPFASGFGLPMFGAGRPATRRPTHKAKVIETRR